MASETLVQKLHHDRFSDISPKMIALVGCVLNQDWTKPKLVALNRSSDNFITAMEQGDIGFNLFIGSGEDFDTNWHKLLDAANLTDEERAEAKVLVEASFRRA